jgi:hypothetical protein
MDRYGRLLGYIQPDQPNTSAGRRFGSYNERLLAAGGVSPYFIWPNINPFRRASSITDAVPAPGGLAQLAGQMGVVHFCFGSAPGNDSGAVFADAAWDGVARRPVCDSARSRSTKCG